MKKYIYIIVALMLTLTASAQNAPTPFHHLTLKAMPEGIVTMRVTFDGYYYDADGNRKSYYKSYNSDTIDFDFQVPENIRVYGSFYHRQQNLSDWKMTALLVNGVVAESYNGGQTDYSYTMPDSDIDLVLQLEYNPGTPGEPGPNSWNPETGELIFDYYEAGWPSNFNRNEDYPKVKRYTKGGRMNDNSYRLIDGVKFMTNCTYFDFSRTDMVTLGDNYGYYMLNDLPLTEVAIPSTVKTIRSEFFSGTHLQVLSSFALMPPVLEHASHYDSELRKTVDDGQNVFTDPLGMVVRVPAEALPYYQADADWGQFNLVPMDGNFVNLGVSVLPTANAQTLALYKDMHLELTNVRTGQVRRLLIGSRNDYQFRYLPVNTIYNLVLRSEGGAEVARIDNISMAEEDQNVTLPQLKSPHTLTLTVMAGGQQADDDAFTATWFAADGSYLLRGTELTRRFEGETLKCVVSLKRELAMVYSQPDTLVADVGQQPDNLTLNLLTLSRATATFTVVDEDSGQGIGDATVTVVHLLPSGETGTIQTLKTNDQGVATGELIQALSNITISHDIYGSKTFLGNLADSTIFNVPFRQANGTVINISYTYTPRVVEGEQSTVQDSYPDEKNVKYTFKYYVWGEGWHTLTDYRQQNLRFTFFENIPAGANISVTVTSTTGKIDEYSRSASVDENNQASVQFGIVQRGAIQCSFRSTDATDVGVLLFSADNGRLLQRQLFGSKYRVCTLEDLPGGNYYVVMMSQLNQLPNITHRDQLAGLVEGQDYLSKSVSVSNGRLTLVHHDLIPRPTAQLDSHLAESRAFANSAQVSVGDFVTIAATAQFKADIEGTPTDMKLVYLLPEGCQLVDGSVMRGQSTVDYRYDQRARRLTVDWPDMGSADGRIRFCVIPTTTGTITPEAQVTYTLNGEEHSDMVQTNSFTAVAATLFVPEVVNSPTVLAQGKAAPSAPVTLFADGRQVAKTTTNAKGQWQTRFLLPDTTALSQQTITAQIVREGVTYQTEAREVIYDPNAIKAKTVTMSYFNYHPVHLEQMQVVFDCETGVATPSSYGFSNQTGYNTDFTFSIDLTDNDPAKVYDVALYVYTSGAENGVRGLIAKYNPRKNRWVAYDKFNTECLPYMVNVVPHYKRESVGSRKTFDQPFDDLQEDLNIEPAGLKALREQLNTLLAQGEAAYNSGNEAAIPYDEIRNVIRQMNELQGFGQPSSTQPMDFDQLQKDVDELLGPDHNPDTYLDIFGKQLNELGDKINGFQFSTAQGLTEASLLAEGYEKMKLNDGSAVFILPTEESWVYVDLRRDLKFTFSVKAAASRMGLPLREGYDGEYWDIAVEMIRNYAHDIQDYAGKLGDLAQGLLNSIPLWLETSENTAVELAKQMGDESLGWFKSQWVAFKYESVLEYNNTLIKLQEKLKHFKVGDAVGTLASIYTFVNDIISFASQFSNLNHMIKQVPVPCPDDQANADQILSEMKYFRGISIPYILTTLAGDAVAVYSAILALQTAGAAPELGAITFFGSVVKIASSIAASKIYDSKLKANMEYFTAEIARLKCKKCDDPEKCCPETAVTNVDGGASGNQPCCIDPGSCPPYPELPPPGPDGPGSTPILDPSGFVYEGVQSNRVEGVTATVYYKETVKDMYGDEHENVVIWDAENYAQQNPQLTDVNGEYGWDVPAGQWQVKYEKTGYETAYSEWLPVPPPQLDVNQNLRQYSQPVVNQVVASQKGVLIGFDKFMKADLLTTDNIRIIRNGTALEGSIELLNVETENKQQLASRLRFVPQQPLPTGQKLTLTVSGVVESYADVTLGEDFQQEFDIVPVVEQIVAPEQANVVYNTNYSVTISALPAAAAAGQKVSVRLLSDIIATVLSSTGEALGSFTELTLDQNGKAELKLSGDMHGTTGLVLQMVDAPEVQTLVVVNVKDESDFITPMPRANYLTDTELYHGTQIELSCELDNAAIYYTLDGSCPCTQESGSVFRYTQPITLTDDVTLKAMAVAEGYTESEVKVLNYTVRRDSTNFVMESGWNWVSHAQKDNMPKSQLGSSVDQVRSAADNSTVTVMQPATAYLVHNQQPQAVRAQVDGYALNLREYTTQLTDGWNWLPYPLTRSLTPDEALAYAQPQNGDVLQGDDNFAIYVTNWQGGYWEGTLQRLQPGHAYRYKSQGDRLFCMNSSVLNSEVDKTNSYPHFRWFDSRAYAEHTPVVARLYTENGGQLWSGRYEVTAWVGNDCRGNGFWVREGWQSILFLNIVGNQGETVRFMMRNMDEDQYYDITETLTFDADLHGTINEPLQLHVGQKASGINGLYADDSQQSADVYTLEGVKVQSDQQLRKGVYVRSGQKVVVK